MIPESIYKNINRKRDYINRVVIIDNIPLFSWVELNINELCNRTCVFCPRGHGYPNEDSHMSIKLASKIAIELKDLNFNGIVNISGSGEALLTKHIVDIIEMFGDKNINIELTTNGDKLTSSLIKKLYDVGVTQFIVSMYDGPEQVDYFNNLFKEANIDSNFYILRDRWYSKEDNYGLMLTNRAGTIGKQLSSPVKQKCFYPHHALYIDWNGDVLLCCHDMYNKTIKFGNVTNDSLLKVWKDKKLIDIRHKLNHGDRLESPCKNCDVDGTVLGAEHAKLW